MGRRAFSRMLAGAGSMRAGAALLVPLVVACSTPSPPDAPGKSDDAYRADVASTIHDALVSDLRALSRAALDLQMAAPRPTGRGWDPALDRDALARMRDAWKRARSAYERVEGAVAPLMPDTASALDSRYEQYLAQLGPAGDPYLFDDVGVTGLDAVERILYSDTTPPSVIAFEQRLPGYRAAAFPATQREADDFRLRLCAKLVDDAGVMLDAWAANPIDIDGAFRGLIALTGEQSDEIDEATGGAGESRYSQRTLADLRDNLDGTQALYGVFREWLLTKPDGPGVDGRIETSFDALADLYGRTQGDALPAPPATWNPSAPSDSDFGRLYRGVRGAVGEAGDGVLVVDMRQVAALLGITK